MESTQEVALILANCSPYKGRYIYWVLSRKQIEYILTELETRSGGETGLYLDEFLPVISLETYFGLTMRRTRLADKFVVSRTAGTDGRLRKIIVRSAFPVRMRNLEFQSTAVSDAGLVENGEDILGCFHQGQKHLFIVPDLAAIIKKLKE